MFQHKCHLQGIISGTQIHLDVHEEKTGNPVTGLDRPLGFQEVEAPTFLDNRHIKVVRPPLTPRKYSWYPFLLEAESIPGP
jgi:hypothetical protein